MRALAILCLGVSACGGGSSDKSSDMASSSSTDMDSTSSTDMPSSGMSDVQYCDTACAKLIACGVEFGNGCSAGCQVETVFLQCIKKADLTDCNALSLCSFEQYGHDFCGGTSGVPMGAADCNDTATCEANCNIAQPGVAACPCDCIAGLLPVKAGALLINNQCALSKCATECGPTGSGSTCNSCAASMCVNEHAQCASQ